VQFGGDPEFVMVGGESAGGHLSMMMAMTPNETIYQNGFEDVDTTVNGCIDLYGAHDLTDANEEFHQRDLKGEFRFFIAVREMLARVKLFAVWRRLRARCPTACAAHGDATKICESQGVVPEGQPILAGSTRADHRR
jgi:acetyl esterase/lipase